MVQQLRLPSLLIALPKLMDSHFHRAVILLIEQNKDGSVGYIINKPLPAEERDAAFQKRYKIPSYVPVWHGGPLGSHQGVVIHNQGEDPQAAIAVGKLRVSTTEEAIDGLIAQVEKDQQAARQRLVGAEGSVLPFRFVIGTSGWAPKQLEQELKSGLWIQQPLDEKLIFETPWQEMWLRAIDKLGVELLDIAPTSQSYLN